MMIMIQHFQVSVLFFFFNFISKLYNASFSCIQLKALQDEEAARERASRLHDDRKANLESVSFCKNPLYEVME